VLEKTIENAVTRKALELGVVSVKFTPAGQRGYPDRLFFIPGGRPLFIEFKRPGEKLDPLQQHRINLLKELGYEVETHDNASDAIDAVERAVHRSAVGAVEATQIPIESRQVARRARRSRAVSRPGAWEDE
jgi:hypothetical protein